MKPNRIVKSHAPADSLRRFAKPHSHMYEVLKPIKIYKKAICHKGGLKAMLHEEYIEKVIELILLPGAVVRLSESRSAKCRADHVFVPSYKGRLLHSYFDNDLKYKKETVITPSDGELNDYYAFDLRDIECSGGIHFFFDKKLADDYSL